MPFARGPSVLAVLLLIACSGCEPSSAGDDSPGFAGEPGGVDVGGSANSSGGGSTYQADAAARPGDAHPAGPDGAGGSGGHAAIAEGGCGPPITGIQGTGVYKDADEVWASPVAPGAPEASADFVRALPVRRSTRACAAPSLRTDLHVDRIAELSGFRSPQNLCRVFRRAVGATPLEYRREQTPVGMRPERRRSR
jgi:hypothetical protein